jgi:hypothetical protein
MTRLETTVLGLTDATSPAKQGTESEHGSGPAGAIASSRSSPASNAALFGADTSATIPQSIGAPSERGRPTPSSEVWVQITLCVIVTILLLAVISLPKRSELYVRTSSQQNAYDLHLALQRLRTAVGDYRFDHGVWPGMRSGGSKDAASQDARARTLEQQLFSSSDVTGESIAPSIAGRASASRALGPYLNGHLPTNPIDGLSSVHVLGEGDDWPELADDSAGWIYQPRTGEVRANAQGWVPGSSLRYYDL